MQLAEMVALIQGGVPQPGGTWADLGAGSGNFTRALARLLHPQGVIYAVDRDEQAIRRLRTQLVESVLEVPVYPVQADFTDVLDLPPLDGILMANALHFQRDATAVLGHVNSYLQPRGRLLLVEYDVRRPRSWVPFPIPWSKFPALADAVNLSAPALVGTRRSPTTGITMYAAVAQKPML